MKKRILPIVLVLVMLLSLLPAQVFAASYTFDPNATIFTQNYTTETPRPNNLGDYFTVTTTPLSTANKTAAWNTGNNGTSVAVFNKNGSKLYEDTHAILTFTFKKNCNFWFKHLFSISNRSPYSYAELRLNGNAIAKGTSSNKLASPYNVDVKAGDIFEIDFYSEEDFMTPCAMTLKNIRCTDPVSSDVTVTFDANGGEGTMDAQTLTGGKGTLTPNAFTKAGFRFAGWALLPAGEKVYNDGAAVELTADTTLYALWEAEQSNLPVHFDGNGYQEAILDADIDENGHAVLPALNSAKFPSGKRYYDWYIVLADGSLGDRVTASYDLSAYRDSGVTLKAQWYSLSYVIRYNANGADVTGSMEDQRAPFDETIHLSACTLSREGYTFAGWSTSASGKAVYADGAELLREWDDGDWDWGDEGSEDGEHFDLYACWTKDMSDAEAAAREKLEAAKTLLSKNYQPNFKTDKNLLTMAQARLTAGNIEGVTVAMKSAVTKKDLFTDARASIDLDGTLHYKWNDNGTTSSTNLYCDAALILTCDGYTDEVESATVIIGLDEDRALEALRVQGRRIVIPQELNDSTTLASVPHYMVKEGVDENDVDYNSSNDLHLWAEVTWQSSNTSVIGIGSNTTKLYAPYTVKVSRPKTDTSVTLTAALTYSGRDDLKVYFTYTVTVKGTQEGYRISGRSGTLAVRRHAGPLRRTLCPRDRCED